MNTWFIEAHVDENGVEDEKGFAYAIQGTRREAEKTAKQWKGTVICYIQSSNNLCKDYDRALYELGLTCRDAFGTDRFTGEAKKLENMRVTSSIIKS